MAEVADIVIESGIELVVEETPIAIEVTVSPPDSIEITEGIEITVEEAAIELLMVTEQGLPGTPGGPVGPQGPQGIQGPPGVPGAAAESEMPYAERTDIVSDALIYKGQADPGALDAAPVWRIRRLTIGVDGDVTTQWADGDANFDNVWADRATLNYI